MKYLYFILLLLAISCGKETKESQEEVVVQESNFDPAVSRMELRGEAANLLTTWTALQKFITLLENFDHTTASAQELNTAVDDMAASLPEDITSQPVLSRLKVLETRVKAYHALLDHNSFAIAEQQKRFNLLIKALDQFKIQLMEVYELEKSQDELIKNLEELEKELDETDSIESL